MFGLMKFRRHAPANLPAQHQRMHYCGVCKAMGRMYGQGSRIALNYDAIYLSELLTFLGEGSLNYQKDWATALNSYNCFRLPKEEQLPLSLKYAASINVLFSGIKLKDNVIDKGGFIWRTADKAFSGKMALAEQQLNDWGLDLEKLNYWLKVHAARELEQPEFRGNEYLNHLSEATAEITSLIFAQGMKVMGKEGLAGKMKTLGWDFGKMIYLLDAFRDYKKDLKKGEFNPIYQAFPGEGKEMSNVVKEQAQALILRTSRFLLNTQEALPLDPAQQSWFRDRIEENLALQLGLSAAEVKSCTTTAKAPRRKIALRSRWQFTRNIAAAWNSPKLRNRNKFWRTSFAFGAMATLALLFPHTLYAKADMFSFIDPDFLGRFGDLNPDWVQDNFLSNDCCRECCGPNGCCDGCCRNCSRECDECCNTVVTVLVTAVILGTVGIFLIVYFVVKSNRKSADRRREYHMQGQTGAGPSGSPNFTERVQKPNSSREILLASAHDWFSRHFPETMPILNEHEERISLQASGKTELDLQTEKDGRKIDFGSVHFTIEIHVKEENIALRFDSFQHEGSSDVPHGGPLSKPMPNQQNELLNADSWKSIKQQANQKIQAMLNSFPEEV